MSNFNKSITELNNIYMKMVNENFEDNSIGAETSAASQQTELPHNDGMNDHYIQVKGGKVKLSDASPSLITKTIAWYERMIGQQPQMSSKWGPILNMLKAELAKRG